MSVLLGTPMPDPYNFRCDVSFINFTLRLIIILKKKDCSKEYYSFSVQGIPYMHYFILIYYLLTTSTNIFSSRKLLSLTMCIPFPRYETLLDSVHSIMFYRSHYARRSFYILQASSLNSVFSSLFRRPHTIHGRPSNLPRPPSN